MIGEGLPAGGWKWHGGAASSDGRVIYGFPNHSDYVLRIDTTTDVVSLIGGPKVLKSGRHRNPQDGKYKYVVKALRLWRALDCFRGFIRLRTRPDRASSRLLSHTCVQITPL